MVELHYRRIHKCKLGVVWLVQKEEEAQQTEEWHDCLPKIGGFFGSSWKMFSYQSKVRNKAINVCVIGRCKFRSRFTVENIEHRAVQTYIKESRAYDDSTLQLCLSSTSSCKLCSIDNSYVLLLLLFTNTSLCYVSSCYTGHTSSLSYVDHWFLSCVVHLISFDGGKLLTKINPLFSRSHIILFSYTSWIFISIYVSFLGLVPNWTVMGVSRHLNIICPVEHSPLLFNTYN